MSIFTVFPFLSLTATLVKSGYPSLEKGTPSGYILSNAINSSLLSRQISSN
jgi:hypothetical protein